jgi:hypothetical protein
MKSLPSQPLLNVNRRAVCDFLLEKELNTIREWVAELREAAIAA